MSWLSDNNPAHVWWKAIRHNIQARFGERESPLPWREQYALLKSYYHNNGLYEGLNRLLHLRARDGEYSMRPLRNPANRVVEFYAAKMWAHKLVPLGPRPAVLDAIEQVWLWSNWRTAKQECVRTFATCGDLFLKAAASGGESTPPARVYIQRLDPEVVTAFDVDERGYLTFVRLDIPRTRRTDEGVESYTHTEIWDKTQVRVWEHRHGLDAATIRLGNPVRTHELSEFGIDFIPIVWQPFRAVGTERGAGAFSAQIDKIDEANRMATRLHQMQFRYNRALWALQANATDRDNRPLPAPRIGGSSAGADDVLEIDDDKLLRLPGSSTITPLVPPLNYTAMLETLNAHMRELEQDLPELAYYRMRENGQASGRAVRLLLADATDRLMEARANGDAALIRATQMCLTLGAHYGIFPNVGSYESGAFDFSIMSQDVFLLDELEQAQAAYQYVQAGMAMQTALRAVGWDEKEIDIALAERTAEQAASANLAAAYLEAAEANAARLQAEGTSATGGN